MASSHPVVLLIEDELPMRRFLRTALEGHEFVVLEASTAREGIAHTAARNPDVVLLDLGLPDRDGRDAMGDLRAVTRAPIIVISARGQEHEKVKLLDLGADDYLTKPFGSAELLARIRVALRHATRPLEHLEGPVLLGGGIRVDALRRQVFRDDDEIHLTPTEYKLLATLVRQVGRVLTHRQLLEQVWGINYARQTHYLRVYMAQLRQKLEHDSTRPKVLITEPGIGYRLLEREVP